jgi:ketosteroid isomerase-like protein
MTPEKLQSIAFKWFESFNNKELEKLLSLYDDDAVHFSPKLKMQHPESDGFVSGKKLCVAGGKMLLNVYPV